jgi:hypothetical protein
LDLAFEDYIAMLTGKEDYEKLTPGARRKMIHSDFDRIKRRFGNEEEDDDIYSVDLKGVKNKPESGITDGTIVLER